MGGAGQFETGSKKGLSPRERFGDHRRRAERRGMAQESLDLIEAMSVDGGAP